LRDTGAAVRLDVCTQPSPGEARRRPRHSPLRLAADGVDVVHAIGYEAAEQALSTYAGTCTPVVVTFVADPPEPDRERALVVRADAVLAVSAAERQAWRAAHPDRLVGHCPLPVVLPDDDAVTPADGALMVSDATGALRDALVGAVGRLSSPRLVLVDGTSDARLVSRASLVVSSRTTRRGGLAGRAAVHGVPAVVVGGAAAADTVVDGATGLVVEHAADVSAAVRSLLRRRTLSRAFGMAARLRVKATRSPAVAAGLASAVYRDVVEAKEGTVVVGGPARSSAPEATVVAGDLARDVAGDLVGEHLALAEQLARRYEGRGQSLEDLVQVANLGLVHAARRYDPERGSPFSAFAAPTILGELRKYFRDQAWAVRVPRRVQEAALAAHAAREQLRQERGLEPTAADHEHLATSTGLSVDDVRGGLRARATALSPESLDRALDADATSDVGDVIGESDPGFDAVDARESVRVALEKLPERQREVLTMRFYGEHTQAEIAARLGVSQVQVSRTLRRTLDGLREALAT
jgi:RNA polymerase sigma-B factor